ncbi:hypothetical protein A3Q56_02376 [Intoshia linei]|uniref:Uncharacterized protein n=1 Tax=Intoshia linei TaxID=1819745 RepID=A0A177B867_9BILA|nr:hypothetical protein A3Q56_02376 [Intoshia linei]
MQNSDISSNDLNNIIVSLRKCIKTEKRRMILTTRRQIKVYRERKLENFNKRAEKLEKQLVLLNNIDNDELSKFCLSNELSKSDLATLSNLSHAQVIAIKFASLPKMKSIVKNYREKYFSWREMVDYLIYNVSGTRHVRKNKINTDLSAFALLVRKNDLKEKLDSNEETEKIEKLNYTMNTNLIENEKINMEHVDIKSNASDNDISDSSVKELAVNKNFDIINDDTADLNKNTLLDGLDDYSSTLNFNKPYFETHRVVKETQVPEFALVQIQNPKSLMVPIDENTVVTTLNNFKEIECETAQPVESETDENNFFSLDRKDFKFDVIEKLKKSAKRMKKTSMSQIKNTYKKSKPQTETIHPSWSAKRKEKSKIQQFTGTRTTNTSIAVCALIASLGFAYYLYNRSSNVPEVENIDDETSILDKIINLKETGNKLFINDDYEQARDVYTQALECTKSTEDVDSMISKLYQNRAAVYNKMEEYDLAIEDCSRAIEYDEFYVKAYIRRSNIYRTLNLYDEAMLDFIQLFKINDQDVKVSDLFDDFILEYAKYKTDDYVKNRTKTTQISPTCIKYFLDIIKIPILQNDYFKQEILPFNTTLENNLQAAYDESVKCNQFLEEKINKFNGLDQFCCGYNSEYDTFPNEESNCESDDSISDESGFDNGILISDIPNYDPETCMCDNMKPIVNGNAPEYQDCLNNIGDEEKRCYCENNKILYSGRPTKQTKVNGEYVNNDVIDLDSDEIPSQVVSIDIQPSRKRISKKSLNKQQSYIFKECQLIVKRFHSKEYFACFHNILKVFHHWDRFKLVETDYQRQFVPQTLLIVSMLCLFRSLFDDCLETLNLLLDMETIEDDIKLIAKTISAYCKVMQRGDSTDLNKLIVDNPDCPYLYNLRGQIMLSELRLADSLFDLKKFCHLSPNDLLGKLRCMMIEDKLRLRSDPSEQFAILNTIISLEDEYKQFSLYHVYKSELLFGNDAAGAIECMKTAIKIDSNIPSYYAHIGQYSYIASQNIEDAEKYFKQCENCDKRYARTYETFSISKIEKYEKYFKKAFEYYLSYSDIQRMMMCDVSLGFQRKMFAVTQ